MGSTHKQSKNPMDVAADGSSLDSLSFTSLVCIDPNHQSKSLTAKPSPPYVEHNKLDHNDREFEFKNPRNPNINSLPNHIRPLDDKKSQPPSLNGGETPTVFRKSKEVAKHRGGKDTNGSRSWFGRKLFQSFVSPCRECRVVKPSMKAHVVRRERIESH